MTSYIELKQRLRSIPKAHRHAFAMGMISGGVDMLVATPEGYTSFVSDVRAIVNALRELEQENNPNGNH